MILERPASDPINVLENVPWDVYTALRDEPLNDKVRMIYDSGTLILMSPSHRHERADRTLARLVEHWALERNLPLICGGSTTFRDELQKKGLEPDTCFYVSSACRMQSVQDIDLAAHPPPDLVIEVDATRTSRLKLSIYALLGMPEVWLFDLTNLRFLELSGRGYREIEHSRAFPELAPDDLLPFLERVYEVDDVQLIREFREWIRREHGSL